MLLSSTWTNIYVVHASNINDGWLQTVGVRSQLHKSKQYQYFDNVRTLIPIESTLEYKYKCENGFCRSRKTTFLPTSSRTSIRALTRIRGGASNPNQDDEQVQEPSNSKNLQEECENNRDSNGEIQQEKMLHVHTQLETSNRNPQQYPLRNVPPPPSLSSRKETVRNDIDNNIPGHGTHELSAARSNYESKYYGARMGTQHRTGRVVKPPLIQTPPSPPVVGIQNKDAGDILHQRESNRISSHPPPPPPPPQESTFDKQRGEPPQSLQNHEPKPVRRLDEKIASAPLQSNTHQGQDEKVHQIHNGLPPPPPSRILDETKTKQHGPNGEETKDVQSPLREEGMGESKRHPDEGLPSSPPLASQIVDEYGPEGEGTKPSQRNKREEEGDDERRLNTGLTSPPPPLSQIIDDSGMETHDRKEDNDHDEEPSQPQKTASDQVVEEEGVGLLLDDEDEKNDSADKSEQDQSKDPIVLSSTNDDTMSSADMSKLQRSLVEKSMRSDKDIVKSSSTSMSSWMMHKASALGKRLAKSMWEKSTGMVIKSIPVTEKEIFVPIRLNPRAISLSAGAGMPWGNEHQWVTHTMALFTLYFDLWSVKCPQSTRTHSDNVVMLKSETDKDKVATRTRNGGFSEASLVSSNLREVGTTLNHAESILVSAFLSNAITSAILNETILHSILPAVYNHIDSYRPPEPVPVPQPTILKREKTIITKTTKVKETILSRIDPDEDLDDLDFARLLVELEEGPIEEIIEEVGYEYDVEPLDELVVEEVESEEVHEVEDQDPGDDDSSNHTIHHVEITDIDEGASANNYDITDDEEDLLEDDELEILESARFDESDWIDQFCDEDDDED